MAKYRVMVVGMGKRGKHHAVAFRANPSFELVGICDIVPSALPDLAAQLGGAAYGTDAKALAQQVRPEVLCFCTHPSIRLPLIELGVSCGAKLIAFEKPLAAHSAEAVKIRSLLEANPGVKAVVSHQHRYGKHYQKVREIIAQAAHLSALQPFLPKEFFQEPGLVLHTLIDFADSQLLCPMLDGPGLPARKNDDLDTGFHQQLQPLAVSDMKMLGLFPPVIHNNPSIRKYPIHIKHKEPDPCKTVFHVHTTPISFSR